MTRFIMYNSLENVLRVLFAKWTSDLAVDKWKCVISTSRSTQFVTIKSRLPGLLWFSERGMLMLSLFFFVSTICPLLRDTITFFHIKYTCNRGYLTFTFTCVNFSCALKYSLSLSPSCATIAVFHHPWWRYSTLNRNSCSQTVKVKRGTGRRHTRWRTRGQIATSVHSTLIACLILWWAYWTISGENTLTECIHTMTMAGKYNESRDKGREREEEESVKWKCRCMWWQLSFELTHFFNKKMLSHR